MPTKHIATLVASPSAGTPAESAVASCLPSMRSRRLQHIRAALCLIAGILLPITLGGCSSSPRQEYLQTRSVEITPSSSGDGTLLANRDKIMTGDKGPSAPLASVESQPDKQ